MDIAKLIDRLVAWNEQHLSVVCGNGHFACDYLCGSEDCIVVQATTALSTLQAESEKLRAELAQMAACVYYKAGGLCQCGGDDPANVCVMGPCPHEISVFDLTQLIHHVRLRLEDVKAERDAAVSDTEALMWFSGEGCRICAHAIEVHKEPYVRLDCDREKGTDCCPKWRGQKED